jgi:membrane-anchored glycerophosphoryl diester phosphodiesterase (GDPDase)
MNYEKIKKTIDPNKNTRDLRKVLEARVIFRLIYFRLIYPHQTRVFTLTGSA